MKPGVTWQVLDIGAALHLVDVSRDTQTDDIFICEVIVSQVCSVTRVVGNNVHVVAPFQQCDTASLLEAAGMVSGINKGVAAARLLQARSFIDANISDRGLFAERVAGADGVTLRHLNRMFAESGTSVSRLILEQRLDRAMQAIEASSATRATVADIAARVGVQLARPPDGHDQTSVRRDPRKSVAAPTPRKLSGPP